MPGTATRRVTIYINDKEVENNIKSIKKEMYKLTSQQAKMTIGSKEYIRTGQEIKRLDKIIRNHRESIRNTGGAWQKLKGFLPIASIGTLLAGAGRLGKELFNLSKTIQGEAVRSSVVFGNQLGYVEEQADKVAKKMGVTNREFVSMAAATADLLIPLDFTRETSAKMSVELQKLTGALDEWTAGSIGANEISQILTKAMLGENEQLKRLGIAIRKDTDEFRDLVKQKIETERVTKAQAEAMATLELIQKKSLDAQTAYYQEGNKLLRFQKETARLWRQMKENVVGWLEVPASKELEREQYNLNLLVGRLTDANIKEEERQKVISQLNQQYPSFLAGLDTENLQLDELRERLRRANEQYVARIILQQKQEKIEKAAEKTARRWNMEKKARVNIENVLIEAAAELNASEQILGKSFQEQYDILKPLAEEQNKQKLLYQYIGAAAIPLSKSIANLNRLQDETAEKQEIVNELQEERIKLAQELGIALDSESEIQPQGLTTNPVAQTAQEQKAEEERVKIIESALQQIRELEEEYTRSRLSQDEKEIEDIKQKYKIVIDSAKAAGLETKKLEEQLQNELSNTRLRQQAERDAKAREAEEEFQEKKLAFLKEYSLLSAEELRELEIERIQKAYEQDLINEEQFQILKAEVIDRYRQLEAEKDEEAKAAKLESWKQSLADIQAGTQTLYNAIDSLRSADLAKLDAQKQKELKLAGDNADARYSVEQKFAEKEKELKKKYADIDFAIKVATIAASTAAAIMGTWEGYADMGPIGTILAGIQTAALVIAGGAQVAAANRERQSVKQLAKGKYPVIGDDDGRLYHAEYYGPVSSSGVINNGRPTLINERGGEMVTTADHLESILQLNPALFKQWMSYNPRVPQRAEGNYPQVSATGASGSSEEKANRSEMLLQSIYQLMVRQEGRPVRAFVVYDDIEEARDTKEDIENYASGN